MHRSESRELLSCAACGAAIDPRERVYGFGAEEALCFSCAVDRGGAYDAGLDRWSQSPDVSDLMSESERGERPD